MQRYNKIQIFSKTFQQADHGESVFWLRQAYSVDLNNVLVWYSNLLIEILYRIRQSVSCQSILRRYYFSQISYHDKACVRITWHSTPADILYNTYQKTECRNALLILSTPEVILLDDPLKIIWCTWEELIAPSSQRSSSSPPLDDITKSIRLRQIQGGALWSGDLHIGSSLRRFKVSTLNVATIFLIFCFVFSILSLKEKGRVAALWLYSSSENKGMYVTSFSSIF